MNNKIYFYRPAAHFEEACPIGNGSIGAMVYGRCDTEKISLNHDTFWSGEPGTHKNPKAYDAFVKARELVFEGRNDEAQDLIEDNFTSDDCEYYLPVGNIWIEFDSHESGEYCRVLDMKESTVDINDGFFDMKHFISYPDKVMVTRISFAKASGIIVCFDSQVKHSVECDGASLIMTGHAPYCHYAKNEWTENPEHTSLYDDKKGIGFTLIQHPCTNGNVSFDSDKMRITDATEIVLYTSLETSFVRFDALPNANHREKAKSAIIKAVKLGYETLLKRHIDDVRSVYDRVSVSFTQAENKITPEELMKDRKSNLPILSELMFNFGRYLSIASSRQGSEATNLQGIWNENLYAPWRCDYTVNINTQMNYWHMPMTGLLDCFEPLIDKLEAIAVTGRETAKEFYHADGFTCHHNTDVWAHTEPVAKGRRITALFSFWYMSPAWFICQLYDAFQYTHWNIDFAKRIYALQKEFCKFCLSIMTECDGKLILSPATSPEVGFWFNERFISVSAWTAVNQESCYKLFEDCIELTHMLGEDESFAEKLSEALPKLQMPILDEDGRIVEWDKDYKKFDPTNRHVSHCWGLYPGGLYTPDRDPEMAKACEMALLERGLDGTGWSTSWKISLMAMLGDKEKTEELLFRQFHSADVPGKVDLKGGGTYPNLFDAHPPFQIDGNFGIVSGITNLIMQSDKGVIKLLPALPKSFASGSVKGLLAKGGVRCDITWKDGKITDFTLLSNVAKTIEVIYNSKSVMIELKEKEPFEFRG
ncbi:MAG: glycoside hydrolase family 95 protein [Ruminococcaceae bacterium]|nr:glycoside hydrolase family 95 protein [Oscillospiraceae bacterium]